MLTVRLTGCDRTRTEGGWTVAVLFAIVLLLLLIFVPQNGQRAEGPTRGVTDRRQPRVGGPRSRPLGPILT